MAESPLNDSVFQRVKCNDTQPSSGSQQFYRFFNCLGKQSQLLVHLNSDGLEGSLCRMRPASPGSGRNCIFYYLRQLSGGFNWPIIHYKSGYTVGPAFFAIISNYPFLFPLRILVNHVICSETLCRIHPHIKGSILHI